MVKDVELRKIHGITQHVDWETGEELFKKSDCIPISLIKEYIKKLEKEAKKDFDGTPISTIEEIETLGRLLSTYKERGTL